MSGLMSLNNCFEGQVTQNHRISNELKKKRKIEIIIIHTMDD